MVINYVGLVSQVHGTNNVEIAVDFDPKLRWKVEKVRHCGDGGCSETGWMSSRRYVDVDVEEKWKEGGLKEK